MKTTNNTHEVNGSHYESDGPLEPVHLMQAFNMNWFQGEILKYCSRHWRKNGINDLNKAIHIADMAKDFSAYTPNQNYLKAGALEFSNGQRQILVAYQEQYRYRFENPYNSLGDFDIFINLLKSIINQDYSKVRNLIQQISRIYYA